MYGLIRCSPVFISIYFRLFLHFLGKHVFASLVVVYRYGRQEDELIPGLSFMKEMVCDRVQVYPEYQGEEISKFQVKRD